MKKKILSVLLCLCLMAGVVPIWSTPAKAAGNGVSQKIEQLKNKYPHGWYWNHRVDNYAALGDNLLASRSEAYQDSVTQTACWTHNGSPDVGQGKYDCSYFDGGLQCWGFAAKLFYDIFGVRCSTMPRRTDRENISVGDYVRYGTDDRGHSFLVTGRNGNTITVVECNYGYGAGDRCQIKWGRQQNLYADLSGYSFGYFRHASNYDAVNDSVPSPTPDHPADIGDDFYATILNTNNWTPISEVDNSDNIYLRKETGSPRQTWRFQRQSDGAYVIKSCNDGKVLEMTSPDNRKNNNPIYATTDNFWGGAYQQWYLIPQGDGYVFLSKHYQNEQWVMDYRAANNAIQIYERNNSKYQVWSVYKGDDIQLSGPNLTVQTGNSATKTRFTWNDVYGEKGYNLRIWNGSTIDYKNEHKTIWDASSGYSAVLPAGTYYAYVDAYDYFHWQQGKIVVFTIPKSTMTPTPVPTTMPTPKPTATPTPTPTPTPKPTATPSPTATPTTSPTTAPTPGKITITGVTAQNTIYNGQRHPGYTGTPYADGAKVQVTYSGRNGTSYSSSTAPKNAGNYTVTFKASGANGEGELSLDFTIIKASITIRADNKNVQVGGRLPELTCTVTGLAGNDMFAVRPQINCVGRPDLSAPTSYIIRASGAKVPSGGNYNENITYIDGFLNVYPGDEPEPNPTPSPNPDENTEIFFYKSKQYVGPGKTLELVALDTSKEPYSGKLEWWSDDTSIATVDGNGMVTGIKNGNAVIRASTADGKSTASCEIVVGPWYQRAVDYVMQKGLMSGYGDGSFGANDRLTRAQLAQILYNKEGRPAVTVTDRFPDIRKDAWYSKAVSWAAEKKIVSGYGNGKFGHGDNILRQDLAVMLWRYAGSPAPDNAELLFSDVNLVSSYAKPALCWAAENKIMSGSGGKLNPRGYATRAEVAQMLMNYFATSE